MTEWSGSNRRKFPRVHFPCLIKIQNSQGNSVILTHTENIGVGGICVVLKEHFKPSHPVYLEIDLMDMNAHLQCSGKVAWCVQRRTVQTPNSLFYEIGIEFENLNPDDQKRINAVVDHLVKYKI